MLHAAGKLTIELAQAALDEGFGLKDATPYNILFRGSKPVFVDVLSFERRDPGDPTWLPYAQFLRTFILPLLMNQYFGVTGAEVFLSHTDGYQPDELYRRFSWIRRLRAPVLTAVSIPTWLGRRTDPSSKALYQPKHSDPEKARFVLDTQFRRLRKLLDKVKPAETSNSAWSSYMRTFSYSDEDFSRKSGLVKRWLTDSRPATVLDIGCNTGHFSAIAATTGARVVAIDADPAVVGSVWQRAQNEELDILPLTVNIARPTPACGWRNAEYPSFLERATGSFEMVMMLALIHHLIVTERIPLSEVFSIASALTTGTRLSSTCPKKTPCFNACCADVTRCMRISSGDVREVMPAALHGDRETGSERTTTLPLPAPKAGSLDSLLLAFPLRPWRFLPFGVTCLPMREARRLDISKPALRIFEFSRASSGRRVLGGRAVFLFSIRRHARRS